MQTLANICIKRPVFATMLILALMVLGVNAYFQLGVDLFPKVDFPFVTITTTLRGAAPEEVESQVSKRIEEAVNTISGIDELRSTSAEGVSQVQITFVLEKDPDVGAQEVRDAVNKILNTLPRDADPPIIEKVASDASPVLNVVVASNRDPRETTKLVDDLIKKNLESISGVGQVRFVGDRQRQIQVWLDGEKLYSYNLNVDQVRAAVSSQNVEIPGGRVDQGSREVSLRTLGRVERPVDFNRILVANSGGRPIRISDIGRVADGVEEPRSLAMLDGQPAVVLEIRKQAGTNTLAVIKAVKERIDGVRNILPPDFKITYARDQSGFIEQSFEAVQAHLVEGAIFASIIVLLFMRNWRATLIAAIAIPTSVISTYTLMQMMGFTLNQITMLSLVLMVGIVIDDAIVVLENIFKNLEEKNLDPVAAAIEGTREIGLAVLATTLSLVIVFLPVALMSGIVGKFMSSFGYTAAFAIMVSLLVSFTLTPMLCSRFLKKTEHKEGASSKDTWLYKVLDRPYAAMLRWSMRHRWAIVTVAVLVLISTGPIFMTIGKDFLPKDDQSEFEVTVRLPPGSSLEGSAKVFEQVEAELRGLPGVAHLLTTIGADSRQQVDRGSVIVELVPVEKRKEDQFAIMDQARARLQKFRDLTIGVQPPAVIQGAGSTKEFQFFIQGTDLKRLEEYSSKIMAGLAALPGVVDLESSYEAGKPELRVRINRDKASDLSVSVSSVATAMQTLVGGDDQVSTYREGDDRYDVQLRVEKEFRTSTGALERLYVPSTTLGNVAVSNVARFEEATGPTQIDRYNRQRQIMITANILKEQNSQSKVIEEVDKIVAGLDLPPGYATGLTGQSKEFGRAAANFLAAALLSFIFMYMILAAQFESFVDPITILISLPMSIPFALISLMAFGENFSIIYSSVGVLVLFGIVKKNSILQIDHIKQLRAKGMPRFEAIIKGCEDRLRPILMTTAALVAGMIPLAVGTGAGAGSRRSAAITVIGGQTLCLLLTLLLTPVAYSLFDDFIHSPIWGKIGRAVSLRGARARRGLQSATGLFGVLALLFVFAGPAQAQTPATRLIALKEAVELALKNNLEVEITRNATSTARAAFKAAQGAFDPVFRVSPGYENRRTPTSSLLLSPTGTVEETVANVNSSYLQTLPWNGTQFSAGFDNRRDTTNNPFTGLTPFYSSRFAATLAQPILRGRETDNARTELIVRKRQAGIADLDLEARAVDVVSRVQAAYWDLLAAQRDALVKRDSVDYARTQLEMNLRMIASGTLAAVERAASEAELERRKDSYLSAVELTATLENSLKTLIASGREDAIWGQTLVPSDAEPQKSPAIENVDEAMRSAIGKRVELRQLILERENANDRKRLARDLTRPGLTANLTYAVNGLGGVLNPNPNPITGTPQVVPPAFLGGLGTSLGNMFQYPTVQAGLTFDWNIRNRAAEGLFEQTAAQERQLRLETARIEQAVTTEVRNALQAISTARQRIAAADASARAAQEKLESELRLFGTGESTNFLVLTRQNELADSRTRAIAARLNLYKAQVNLARATGTALEAQEISLR